MRALITGINGFTGRYVAAELERAGYEVFGTGSQPSSSLPRYYSADLLDKASLRRCISAVGPQVVVHLAAIAFVGHGDPAAFYQINVVGTRNLLEVLAAQPEVPDRVLLASSANIYGNSIEGVLSEITPAQPANDYAVSKLAMEYMAKLWLDKLPIVIARPFNYTGVGQSEKFLLPKIVQHFRRHADVIELGNLDVWRDFSDVRSVAEAYRLLLQSTTQNETVNVCSGVAHSLREVIAMASAVTGHSIQIKVNPEFVRSNEVRTLCGDPARLKSVIGSWNVPPLEETLRWMLRAA